MSDIYSKLNEQTFYIKGSQHDNLVTVIRKIGGMTWKQKKIVKKLTMNNYYDARNNGLFNRLCPLLVWYPGCEYIGIWMNICAGQMKCGKDFLIVKKTLGDLLQVVAEIMSGEPITDRAGTLFNFGKPIELEELMELYRTLVNKKENSEFMMQITVKSINLRKCCKHKARGLGSITKVIEKIC